jgi:hypothetical protein
VSKTFVVQYLSRKYCFTACMKKDDGNYEATLSRRSPGLAQRKQPGTSRAAMSEAEDERFSSASQLGALLACNDAFWSLTGRSWQRSQPTKTTSRLQRPGLPGRVERHVYRVF